MKNIFVSSALMLMVVSIQAQKINVNPQKESILENKVNGYKSKIEGPVDDVLDQWIKKLRTLGKYRARGTYATVTNFSINGYFLEDSTLYAISQSDENSVTVWLGSSVPDTKEYSIDALLKSAVYNFTKSYYLSVVENQIEEAERDVFVTKKRHQRLLKDSVEYASKLTATKNEIIRLARLVARNKLEEKALDAKILINQNERDSVLIEVDKMKQIVEDHKKRKNVIE